MKSFYKNISICATLLTFVVSGCTKNFEKINTDPDALTDGPPLNMLVNVIRNTGEQFGGDVDGYGTFAGYIVKIQYMDFMSGLVPTNNSYGNRWYACYYNNAQLNYLLEQTAPEPQKYKNVRSVARIWQNYMWSYLLDGWGDIPYTDALKGLPEKGSVLTAKYDKQEDVYPAVLKSLKEIADDMAEGVGEDDIRSGDFIYGSKNFKDISIKDEMLRWQKFCNSLRLRIAMRISGVSSSLAKATIEEIAGDKGKYPVLETNDENCYLRWPGSKPYFEPWYSSGVDGNRINNWGISDIFIDHLASMDDPRLAVIATKNNEGKYVGFPNGASKGPEKTTSVSWIGNKYIQDPVGFTPFYKSCETYYILSEAAMLGYNVGITAESAYTRAVHLSMEDNGVAGADITKYLEGKGKWNDTKERIWWDMWVALFKANFEAWSLYRRTGIPLTNYPSLNSIFGKKHNDQPWRLPYPNNEYLYNKENTEAAASSVVDYVWGKQLWWDTRKGKF
ncbi:SusD/RagB family nutrient-binding outer membrane lipoprotein [Sphingobacterium sp. HMA12]|uniref:SusD/RagB family nutrient-binding outer membrane lipoprotein n=1 Tax=Sphingobacterium sp. HMA12 TaxID=2050894 RepID=UPI000CEA0C72|nr:SusD/RagB family nutrient-binding outer membrane lipoprotein [Sphingobacterium sp. HMA12]